MTSKVKIILCIIALVGGLVIFNIRQTELALEASVPYRMGDMIEYKPFNELGVVEDVWCAVSTERCFLKLTIREGRQVTIAVENVTKTIIKIGDRK